MALLIFIVGVMVAVVLRRQAGRQSAGLTGACATFGVQEPAPPEPLPWPEILLNLYVGSSMAFVSGLYVLVTLFNMNERFAREGSELGAAAIGTGIVMVVLAFRNIRARRKKR